MSTFAPDLLRLRICSDPTQLVVVRHTIARWLVKHQVPRSEAEDAVLAAHEAAANAIQHGEGEVELLCCLANGHICVTVRDHGTWKLPAEDDLRGRGLAILEALSGEVVIDTGDEGTTVRMRIALS